LYLDTEVVLHSLSKPIDFAFKRSGVTVRVVACGSIMLKCGRGSQNIILCENSPHFMMRHQMKKTWNRLVFPWHFVQRLARGITSHSNFASRVAIDLHLKFNGVYVVVLAVFRLDLHSVRCMGYALSSQLQAAAATCWLTSSVGSALKQRLCVEYRTIPYVDWDKTFVTTMNIVYNHRDDRGIACLVWGLANDLYCVQRDVKLITIAYLVRLPSPFPRSSRLEHIKL